MKKKLIGILVCTLLIVTGFLPVTGTINENVTRENKFFEKQTSIEFAPGEFIVKLKKDATFLKSSLTGLNEKHQVYTYEKVFPNAEGTILDNIYLVHVPIESDILSIVHEYELCPDVVYTEPNYIVTTGDVPNDVNFSNQWYLDNTGQEFEPGLYGTPDADIDAPEAWDIEKGSQDIVIAIPDTGIDYTHPDLADKIWNNEDEIPGNGIDDDNNGYIDDVIGWDFVYNDNDPKDDRGHGTMIAGVVAASTDNSLGIAGVTWNCKLMTMKVIHYENYCLLSNLSKGIKYAADNDADVISMSFSSEINTLMLRNAVDYAYDKGVFLCAVANNYNNSKKQYPAAWENVTAVGGTDENDHRAWWSSYGDWVHIAAPGNIIYSTMPTYHVVQNDPPDNRSLNYAYGSGTSFSCPMVASVAALLLSKDPSLTPHEIDAILCANVDPYYSAEYIGTGRLNAHKALLALQLKEETKIKGGLGVSIEIINNGAIDITNAYWQIHVEGGILGSINTTMNGTIDIKAGETQTVSTGILLGFGSISISAEVAGIEKIAEGTQLLIYSMVK